MKTGKEIDKAILRGLRAPKPNEPDKTLIVKVEVGKYLKYGREGK
jgi:hypothetical protein